VTLALPRDPQGNVFGMIAAGQNGRVESGDGAAITWFEILGPEPKALRDYDVQHHIGGPGPVEVMDMRAQGGEPRVVIGSRSRTARSSGST
jgi:hypothetical protein